MGDLLPHFRCTCDETTIFLLLVQNKPPLLLSIISYKIWQTCVWTRKAEQFIPKEINKC